MLATFNVFDLAIAAAMSRQFDLAASAAMSCVQLGCHCSNV